MNVNLLFDVFAPHICRASYLSLPGLHIVRLYFSYDRAHIARPSWLVRNVACTSFSRI
jgi:hypothetical protein